MNTARVDKIRARGDEVEDVAGFAYLVTKVSKDGGETEYIKNRLRRYRGAFENVTKL